MALLLANEPEIRFKYFPGAENIGADLLSRPYSNERSKDIDGHGVEVNQFLFGTKSGLNT